MAYLLDTDRVIDALGGQTSALTLLQRLPTHQVAVSVVTVGEVLEIAFNSPNPQAHLDRFRSFMGGTNVLSVTEPIMGRFAEIRAYLRRRGEMISDFDIIIGATALEHDLLVLTRNERHFSRIPDLRLYRSDT